MLDWQELAPLRDRLNAHPVYASLRTMADLRCFMQHHIHSVWDFMSLVKSLQATVAPARVPWVPVGDPEVRRFINELVLEEESDLGLPDSHGTPTHLSHFELYCAAMREVGADPEPMLGFVATVADRGIDAALALPSVPAPSRAFTETTFGFVASGKPHVIAAALAHGREHVIPAMFRAFLRDMRIGEAEAPAFHYYLNRHIHLDEDFHAPLSLRLLDHLCGGDPARIAEARAAAAAAIEARIAFWDGVRAAIEAGRDKAAA